MVITPSGCNYKRYLLQRWILTRFFCRRTTLNILDHLFWSINISVTTPYLLTLKVTKERQTMVSWNVRWYNNVFEQWRWNATDVLREGLIDQEKLQYFRRVTNDMKICTVQLNSSIFCICIGWNLSQNFYHFFHKASSWKSNFEQESEK